MELWQAKAVRVARGGAEPGVPITRRMAIYSLNRKPISRTRHRAGFAAAHARYVLRPEACSTVIALLPGFVEATRSGIATWLANEERQERRNARMGDRVMVALPREFAERAQRVAVIEAFADAITGRRIPYFAGLHDLAGDADNPHAHVFFRDRCFVSGRPVVGLRELATTEWIREVWEATANAHLAAAGYFERVDRRSHTARGIWDRPPGRHLGPGQAA